MFLCKFDTAMRAASCGGGSRLAFSAGTISKSNCAALERQSGVQACRGIVRVARGHAGCRLRGQCIELSGGDALVHAGRDLLCHQNLQSNISALIPAGCGIDNGERLRPGSPRAPAEGAGGLAADNGRPQDARAAHSLRLRGVGAARRRTGSQCSESP